VESPASDDFSLVDASDAVVAASALTASLARESLAAFAHTDADSKAHFRLVATGGAPWVLGAHHADLHVLASQRLGWLRRALAAGCIARRGSLSVEWLLNEWFLRLSLLASDVSLASTQLPLPPDECTASA
jgi:hypothetical protein